MQHISTLSMSKVMSGSGTLFEQTNKENYVESIIGAESRTFVSGLSNKQIFIFAVNLALSLGGTQEKFLNFKVKQAKVLYLDLTGVGDYMLSRWFKAISKNEETKDLRYYSLPGLDLNDSAQIKWLEYAIIESGAQVVFLSGIEMLFTFNVVKLRTILDALIVKFKISIVIVATDSWCKLIRDRLFLSWIDDHVFINYKTIDCIRSTQHKQFESVPIEFGTDCCVSLKKSVAVAG